MTRATTMPVPCQVRSKTESPCLRLAVIEMRGIPFCDDCAREQEAYFAIGELKWETQHTGIEPSGGAFGEALEGLRRRRADDLAAAGRLDLPSVDETACVALTESQAGLTEELPAPR